MHIYLFDVAVEIRHVLFICGKKEISFVIREFSLPDQEKLRPSLSV
jgi:hypothetical protein